MKGIDIMIRSSSRTSYRPYSSPLVRVGASSDASNLIGYLAFAASIVGGGYVFTLFFPATPIYSAVTGGLLGAGAFIFVDLQLNGAH